MGYIYFYESVKVCLWKRRFFFYNDLWVWLDFGLGNYEYIMK